MIRHQSNALYDEAVKYFPGGVNSPVRAFKAVEGKPLFIDKGKGSRIWDADGNEYIDFCCSYGPLILGHAHECIVSNIKETVENGTSFGAPTRQENELAGLIVDHNRFIDKIRFVSSGTEAVLSALRLAKAYTGRNKILKFEGCYHGHVDQLLVKAGSGLATFGESSSAGVPDTLAAETIVVPLNDREALKKAFTEHGDELGAVVMEPIPANTGLLIQHPEFLQFVKDQCVANHSLLIFDEVLSGFRPGFEGAAGYYNIAPDIVTYGKVIGGGMPVGAYGARDEIMQHVSPDGPVYQAGTLAGNPVAMAAGIPQIKACLQEGFYEEMEQKTASLIEPVHNYAKEHGYPVKLFHIGSIMWISFGEDEAEVRSMADIHPKSGEYFKQLHSVMMERGIYFGPSGFEMAFMSYAHTQEDIEIAKAKMCESMDEVFAREPAN
jgi:glutamate-1-semialdehyde 2,1-aminomutase